MASASVDAGEFDSSGILSSAKAMLGDETLAALQNLNAISRCLQDVCAVNEPKRAFGISAVSSSIRMNRSAMSTSKNPQNASTEGAPSESGEGSTNAPKPVPPPEPGFHEDSMTLNIIAAGNVSTINAVRELGCYLKRAIEKLEGTLEEHMIEFYAHMKRKSDEENEVLRSTQSKLPTNFQRSMNRKLEQANNMQTDSLTEGKTPQKKKELQLCADTLHSWLHLSLESLMEVTKARKGALYLRASDGYLRQVAEIPNVGEGTGLPTDIGLAGGSTLGTVFQTGVGVNIVRSRFDVAADTGNEENAQMSSSTVLKIRNGITMPIYAHGNNAPGTAMGVVLIADKDTGGCFDHQDEHRVWGFTSAARGVLSRYNHTYFLNRPTTDPHSILRLGAQLPPVHRSRGSLDLKMPNALLVPGLGGAVANVGGPLDSPGVASVENASVQNAPSFDQPSLNNEEAVDGTPHMSRDPPAKAVKQLVVRCANGVASILPKDLQTLPASEVTEEAVLDSLAPYMRHIESMWRKALDTITNLRDECSKWDDTVNVKNNAIIELEIQQKSLQKQLFRVKTDIAKVKSVVPQHLRDSARIVKDPPVPGQQSGEPLPLSQGVKGSPGSPKGQLPLIHQGSGGFQPAGSSSFRKAGRVSGTGGALAVGDPAGKRTSLSASKMSVLSEGSMSARRPTAPNSGNSSQQQALTARK